MFEVELLSSGPYILGWSSFDTPLNEYLGVGMHQSTFGLCIGSSDSIKLHENLHFIEFGEIGDIITSTIDLEQDMII